MSRQEKPEGFSWSLLDMSPGALAAPPGAPDTLKHPQGSRPSPGAHGESRHGQSQVDLLWQLPKVSGRGVAQTGVLPTRKGVTDVVPSGPGSSLAPSWHQ